MGKIKKKVLYISYDGMTDPLGQSQVIPYLMGLSKKGYHFTLISFEKAENYLKDGVLIKKLLDQNAIEWVPLKYHKSPPVLSTLFDLWMMRTKAMRLHQKRAFDIVHCRSYLSALVGLNMKKKFGTKFLFDMRGFWADERVEGGLWNLKNPVFKLVYHFFKRKEKEFLEQADYTVSLTEDGKRVIHSWSHIKNNPVPIKVISCCADLEHFNQKNVNPNQVEAIRNKLGLRSEDFVLLYLGSLGTWYMLEEMLDFFKVLLEYKPDAHFLFLTKDSPQSIYDTASKNGIPLEKLIITASERIDLPNYISMANLAIFFIKPVFSKRASSPTKQGELMGMGIPIICNSGVGDTAEIIQKTRSGAVIAKFNEEKYHEVCQHLEELLTTSSDTINIGAQQYFSLQNGAESYLQVYEKLS